MADAGHERLVQLVLGLRVPVQIDARRVKPGFERQVELAAGGHVAAKTLLGEHPVDGGAGERLRGEQHVVVPVARGERVDERARPRAEVVLGDDVRGRAELLH